MDPAIAFLAACERTRKAKLRILRAADLSRVWPPCWRPASARSFARSTARRALPRWRSKSLRIGSGSPRAVTSAISASMRQRIEVKVVSSLHPRGIVVDVEVEVLVDVLELVAGTE